MKASTILSYAIFLLILVFSTTLFAAESASGKQILSSAPAVAQSKNAKLPSQININPADISAIKNIADIDNYMTKAKAAEKNVKVDFNVTDGYIPMLEKDIADYKNLVNICKNKTYSMADQKNANCTDDMTVAQCSKLLFDNCMHSQILNFKIDKQMWGSSQQDYNANLKELRDNVNLILNNIQVLQK